MPAPNQTAPIELYRDPAIFERERAAIFARTWQFLGLESDLTRPGDYVAEVIAGYPVLVVRDEAGALRGYHNVCRHRAGPLVGEARGRCDQALVCRFHAWRYGFDGRLLEATGFGPADPFDPAQHNLFPIRVEAWRGFVFINMDLEAAPLIETMRPLDEHLGAQPRRPARQRHHHPIACNWKVFVENYLDGYHQEGVHASPSGDASAHRHEVRMVGEVAIYETGGHGHGHSHDGDGVWAWVWPNLGLSFLRGVLKLEHLRPEGPDRTVIDHLFLYEPEDPGGDAAILAAEDITEKDAWMSERVQQNLDAGVFTHGVLSPTHEAAVAWFQLRVAKALKA